MKLYYQLIILTCLDTWQLGYRERSSLYLLEAKKPMQYAVTCNTIMLLGARLSTSSEEKIDMGANFTLQHSIFCITPGVCRSVS